MKVFFKRAAVLLVACMLLFITGISGADNSDDFIDWQKTGTITLDVSLETDISDDLNVCADVYQIADMSEVDGSRDYTFNIVQNLGYLNIDLDSYKGNWGDLAQIFMGVLRNDGLPNSAGQVKMNSSPLSVGIGLYFLVIRDAENEEIEFSQDDEGNIVSVIRAGTDNVYKFKPMMTTIPVESESGEVRWLYDVTVYLKPGAEKDGTSVTVRKVSAGTDKGLAGAKFKLYAAYPQTGDDFINVYVQGMGEVRLYARPAETEDGLYVTDANGEMRIWELRDEENPIPPYTLYALKEVEAPEGYALPEDPYTYFYLSDFVRTDIVNDPSIGEEEVTTSVGGERGVISEGGDTSNVPLLRESDGEHNVFTIKNTFGTDVIVRLRLRTDNDGIDKANFQLTPANDDESNNKPGGWGLNESDGYYYFSERLSPSECTKAMWGALMDGEYKYFIDVEFVPADTDYSPEDGEELWDFGSPEPISAYTHTAKLVPNGTLTIENEPGEIVMIPGAGGSGTWIFIVVGSVLLVGAVVLLVFKLRRPE